MSRGETPAGLCLAGGAGGIPCMVDAFFLRRARGPTRAGRNVDPKWPNHARTLPAWIRSRNGRFHMRPCHFRDAGQEGANRYQFWCRLSEIREPSLRFGGPERNRDGRCGPNIGRSEGGLSLQIASLRAITARSPDRARAGWCRRHAAALRAGPGRDRRSASAALRLRAC